MKSKEEKKVIAFVTKAKETFNAQLVRDKVVDIDITEYNQSEEDATKFTVAGSIETVSPTGKDKAYTYDAVVEIKDGECSFVTLKVNPRD